MTCGGTPTTTASYARNASTDGQRIVYHCAGDVWLLDGLDAADGPRRLEFSLASPAARAPRLVSAEDHLGGLSCDHSGQASAIEVRGTVHWLTHRDGPARALSVVPGVRARLPRVLGQTGQVAWVTDAEGADAIEIAPADGQAAGTPPRRLAAGAIGWASDMAAAPDGSAVAVAARDGRLFIVDVSSGEVTELASSDNGEVTGLAWSPDSAWLAWSHPGPEPLRRLRMVRLADPGRTVVDVTDGRFTDTDPAFTADGKYLAFLSVRSFDPVYDAHVFDLSFPYGCRPYLVPLAAATPSPFAPLPGGRPVGGRRDDDRRRAAAGRARRARPRTLPRGTAGPARTTAGRRLRRRRWPWTPTAWPAGSCRSRWPNRGTPRCARSRAGWPGSGAGDRQPRARAVPTSATPRPGRAWSTSTSTRSGAPSLPRSWTGSSPAATAACCSSATTGSSASCRPAASRTRTTRPTG